MPNSSDRSDSTPTCFVIMPISDQSNYETGHFTNIYNDIIKPACLNAGFEPFRADETRQCNLIQEDILRQLLDAPMAICDLSSQNPNVLFELGIRQAFDLPVTIIKDAQTESIFDISAFRYYQYDESMSYRSVLRDIEELTSCIKATAKGHQAGIGIRSIVGLVDANKRASFIKEGVGNSSQEMLERIYEEVRSLKGSPDNDEVERRENSLISGRGEEVIPKPVRAMLSYNPYAAAFAAKIDLVITLQLILERDNVPYCPTAKEELLDLVVEKGLLDQTWKKTIDSIFEKINTASSRDDDSCFWGTVAQGVHLLYRVINILVREQLPDQKPGVTPWSS